VGARERNDAELPSISATFLLLPLASAHPAASTARPLLPYSTYRSPGVLGSRKYRLSYSFEGAENRYGAFCARATGEIPNRCCRRSFSRAPGLALAGLAARGPPLVGV